MWWCFLTSKSTHRLQRCQCFTLSMLHASMLYVVNVTRYQWYTLSMLNVVNVTHCQCYSQLVKGFLSCLEMYCVFSGVYSCTFFFFILKNGLQWVIWSAPRLHFHFSEHFPVPTLGRADMDGEVYLYKILD